MVGSHGGSGSGWLVGHGDGGKGWLAVVFGKCCVNVAVVVRVVCQRSGSGEGVVLCSSSGKGGVSQ